MALTRPVSANIEGSLKLAPSRENTDAIIASKTMTRAAHRAALGDIGNKVSKMTIDASKKPIKKEIIQAAKGRTLQKNKATSSLKSADIEIYRDKEPAVIVEVLPTFKTELTLPECEPVSAPAPMDISDDKPDAFSRALLTVEDIDANDRDNPQLVSEYVNDIYSYMRILEAKYFVKRNYLEGREVTGKMRAILIDWLCQVHHRFHLLQETLYLTVSIIDRYLQVKQVSKNKLQLVGVTAMLVASKYEEMYAPEVADFVYITDNAYSKADIRDMERDILRSLEFSFGKPLCLHFLRRNSKAGQVDAMKHTLAKYLMELTIVEYDLVQYLPSQIAAAALCLSMKVLDSSQWNDTLSHYSTYSEKDLLPIQQKLAHLVVKAENSKLTAVRTKYSSSKFMKISTAAELKSPALLELAAAAAASS
ncbi:G2/mitotic-specific cyclin-B-like [Haliotis cracherodii]|uniref:G2/mitotic-specific cyclin-B-like n=1 Tax=Haliotis rufescens TaxID=6454 RepID=UPI001EAFB628|nr:G2/mitotic-specific cyclin-B-like [Haliotis rufescens]